MNRKLLVLAWKLFTASIILFAQNSETKIIRSEAKMRETNSPISNIIYTIPVGTQIKTLSISGGYYKVEYRGRIGYINEMYFQSSTQSTSTNVQTSNQERVNVQSLPLSYISIKSKPPCSDTYYKIVRPTIFNLIDMLEMPLDRWRSEMEKFGYKLETQNNDIETICYSGSWEWIYCGVGYNSFYKYRYKKRMEYFISLENMPNQEHYRSEFQNLLNSLQSYYNQANNDFIFYSYPYKNKTYTIAIQKNVQAHRVIVWID